MTDLFIYTIDLPEGLDEMVLPDAEGNYSIYLASRLDDEHRIKAYRHAVDHLLRRDFDMDKMGMDVNDIENEAHEKGA